MLLACKRAHVAVLKRLVTAGCELWVKDSRGRTARHVVQRRYDLATRDNDAGTRETCRRMLELLDSTVQRHLMRLQGRQIRHNRTHIDSGGQCGRKCSDGDPLVSTTRSLCVSLGCSEFSPLWGHGICRVYRGKHWRCCGRG